MAPRKSKMAELVRIAHDRKPAWTFCLKIGIDSPRNLEVYLRRTGVADGHIWTYGELAAEYGFSRPRAVQICQRTEKLLRAHYGGVPRRGDGITATARRPAAGAS